MTTLLFNISEIQSSLNKELHDVRSRVENCEIQESINSLKIANVAIQGSSNSLYIERNSEKIELLEKKFTTELSRYNIKEEETIPYVFSAPSRNRYFAGRTEEIQELKRMLQVEETLREKEVHVAAVCGLGGVGKTSLASEYAHQMKNFYKGGVYWFSAEDDTFLEKTVNDIALKIGALLGSFDLTLSNTLRKISSLNDPSLIVLDCLDNQNLSSNMTRFLSFPSQENIFAHFLVLTRRSPSLLVNEVSEFEENSCLQLKCFLSEEAKRFIYLRTDADSEENVESVAECLCEELGRLPLALEQAGAYIKMLSCDLASYLEQYRTERLRLLNQQAARPVSPGNESSHRLAVHTTWLINMEYMSKSPNGQAAVRFMNACSYFNGNKIEEELVNVGTPEVEDIVYRKCVSSPLGCRQVLKLLTDFSLFAYVKANSISTHRLVQELITESLSPELKAKSFIDAVRMLSYAFSKCSSPSNLVHLGQDGDQQSINVFDLPKSPSHFYMWCELCMHAHNLCRNMEDLIVDNDSVCLDALWFPETAKILYEFAVHLSANHKQEEAKRTLNFAYRTLDWLPLAEYETVKNNMLNSCLFPLGIPLSMSIQSVIKRCCIPPFASLQFLTDKPASVGSGFVSGDLVEKIEKLKMDGKTHFKECRYKEALKAYSTAINLARACKDTFNPFLLTNRATVYIKLEKYEEALKDANDYITRCPDCWRGYARKALALHGLGEEVSSEIAASLAFYHKEATFSDFAPFRETFPDLRRRIFVCNSVDELRESIFSQNVDENASKILVLGSEEYILNSVASVQPWNNCIVVGVRKDFVSLKSNNGIFLLKCMLTNLSFCFDKGGLCCIPGSFVKILQCNFTSNDEETAAVSTEGDFNAEHCNFTYSSSGLICTGQGNAVLVDCSFLNNRRGGLQVREGGTLHLKRCRLFNNVECGLSIKASKCSVFNCVVHGNVMSGIVSEDSKSVFIGRNNVFDNVLGLHIMNSEVDISENNVFDNYSWGIFAQNNSRCNISINRIFRNKGGGIRVGYRAAGKSPCVIEMNKIYDNVGPGLVEDAIAYEKQQLLRTNLGQSYFVSPDYFQPAKCQENEIYNNKESKNISKFNISVPYCSNCRKKCEPNRCRECFTAVYCNKICQENHRSKHKKICKILREKSSLLITSMERAGYDGMIKRHGKDLEEVGPKFSPPPPRDGRKFVVKVQPMLITKPSMPDEEPYTLLLYDRSLELYERILSEVIYTLVQEFGVLCTRQALEKKLFLYCSFEKNGQLRLFINEFPNFLNW